jgi:xanthine dehydrogenase YagR molybdenum-binding subunit
LEENGWLVGYGMANGVFGAGRSQASVRAILQADGNLVLQSAVSDMGPGTTTAMTKIAAENLMLPLNKISFKLGDSDLPPGPTQGGSTTTSTLGTAVYLACETLKKSLRTLAAENAPSFKNLEASTLVIKDGGVSSPTDKDLFISNTDLLSYLINHSWKSHRTRKVPVR